MILHRAKIASLALVALLFGNVAGWVHVDCVGRDNGCCNEQVCDVLPEPGPKAENDCSCHHRETSQAAPSPEYSPHGDSHRSERPCKPRHDSDTCSVCQSFLSTREAIIVCDTAIMSHFLAVCRIAVPADDFFATNTWIEKHRVRGPPSF